MGAVTKKLNSRRGASIVLAMLFFLLCTAIGGIVLTAAASSAGRMYGMREQQQDYLTVSSAAKLVRDVLDGRSFTITETTVDGAPTTVSFSNAGGQLATHLNAWAQHVYNGMAGFTPSDAVVISAPDMKDVTASFTMDAAYDITVVLSLEDGSHAITLTLVAAQSSTSVTTTEDVTDVEGELIGTVSTTVVKKHIQWERPTITKGGAV